MAINVSVQYNGGLLPDIILLTLCYFHRGTCLNAMPRHYTVDPMLLPSGNLFKCHEEVLYLQPLIPPKRFDISPPPLTGGCSEGLGAF